MAINETHSVSLDKRESFSQSKNMDNVASLHLSPSRFVNNINTSKNHMSSNTKLSQQSGGHVMSIAREGLQHPRAVFFMVLWYIFSAGTLFLNKYILSYQKFNPYLLCKYSAS